MNFFENLRSGKTSLLWAMVLSVIIIYPNINELVWNTFSLSESGHYEPWNFYKTIYFIYRYVFFTSLTWMLITVNVRNATETLKRRFWKSFSFIIASYLVYVLIGLTVEYTIRLDCFTRLVILQFLIAWLIPLLIGQIYYLTVIQREKEKEIEQLRAENLQSRVEALSNQINPHFFFNSLNGIAALASDRRYEETIEYVSKLSKIFRYILQSEKKGLVHLNEELEFLDAYRYLIEIRYGGKICFDIVIPDKDLKLQLPVLSLLPLIENIIKHNVIDSEHKMKIDIFTTEKKRLIISNPVHQKYICEASHGIGLTNLSARYKLLTYEEIEIVTETSKFTVMLPLKKIEDESVDC